MSEFDWLSADIQHAELAVGQYEERLRETERTYATLDGKARWALSVFLPLSTAIVAYLYAKAGDLAACGIVGLLALGVVAATSTSLAAWSSTLQTYKGGAVTPNDPTDISSWSPFLVGQDDQLRQFLGMRIRELGKAIAANDSANRRKAVRLKISVQLAASALPMSAIALGVCLWFFGFGGCSGVQLSCLNSA